ncbi:hypothetical protein L6164_035632 [Bauhinia variegata]|uniref:Uncharacterized protein n=1 Tax=Bauhinia variegata TaxID=167791 RepID=A0ACB9KEM0_BAUVA|nr:hypothetical protein L6164_035632 [Bauhinia variegata]
MSRQKKNAGEASEYDDGDSEIELEEAKRTKTEGGFSRYEQSRDLRIKENQERMQKLGLLDLSLKLKSETRSHKITLPKKKTTDSTSLSNQPSRRSSRLKTMAPVDYSESRKTGEKHRKSPKNIEIIIPEGTEPEVYTEEHETLLGDCETAWELYADGFDEDGNRIYDSEKGQTCHQCRQKTLGMHTYCSKCELGQGELCGDCLYARYGENVIEANRNSNWICPACRGICNCSRCRKAKGWMPTGNLYAKVSKLGFKSVAHYLIQTRRSGKCQKNSGASNH